MDFWPLLLRIASVQAMRIRNVCNMGNFDATLPKNGDRWRVVKGVQFEELGELFNFVYKYFTISLRGTETIMEEDWTFGHCFQK